MNTLTLEPDETLPTTPAPLEGEALGPFPIVWRGEERRLLFRATQINRKKHVVFACEVEGVEGNWLIYERETLMPVIWPFQHPHRRLENITLEIAERDWDLARFFTLPHIKQNQSLRVLLLGRNAGAWLDVDVEFRTRATFDFPFPLWVVEHDRDSIRRFWQREMTDGDSTIGFAAQWASLHLDQRVDLTFGGRATEIHQVMEWALRCEHRVWERGGEWDWKLSPHTPDFSYLFCSPNNLEDFAVNLPLLYAMGRFLVEEHLPKLAQPLRKKHRCVREFLVSQPFWIAHFSIKPTTHERLEAALKLRDWLLKQDAPAELLALLGRG